jgi:ABC-type sulfate transport system permease subunit
MSPRRRGPGGSNSFMIIEALIQMMAFIFAGFLTLLGGAFSGVDLLSVDLSQSFGYVLGNIWLLNSFLPVDQLFIVFGLAMSWHVAMFTFDGFLYLVTLWNLAKRSIFRVG